MANSDDGNHPLAAAAAAVLQTALLLLLLLLLLLHILLLSLPGTQVSKEEYASIGASRLGAALSQQLQQQGLRPYYIPVGGSSALGCWGYLNAAQEITEQQQELGMHFDVLASVSGFPG
jgi:1-aminocyclopropane-1-carboxylate deaminase/D-cysteine desulfhydrase-like pyridoxal-dependent ACC family enzyme